ncbi:PAS domain S-box protein [Candidatus Poribacteria bacterium]|nr:PAS domain S-box protein [Candidatus Poribacteria bacterium]
MHHKIQKKTGLWQSFDDIDSLGHSCRYILEDNNKNIWIGNLNGITIYDGYTFKRLNDKVGISEMGVRSMYHDSSGNIWIGTDEGLYFHNGQEFISFKDKNFVTAGSIICIYEDEKDIIWIGAREGLSYYDGNEFHEFKKDLKGTGIYAITQDDKGRIWLGSKEKLIIYDEEIFRDITGEFGWDSVSISDLFTDSKNNIWIGTWGHGLVKHNDDKNEYYATKQGLTSEFIHCIFEDSNGNMWFGTDRGVSHCHESDFVNFTTEDGLIHNNVFSITQDFEGSFWFACGNGGITHFEPGSIKTISSEPVNEIIIKDNDDSIWWGTGNILSNYDGKNIHHYNFEYNIYDLLHDSKDRFWVGTNKGFLKYDSIEDMREIKSRQSEVKDEFIGNHVWEIIEDSESHIWIGTKGCLTRYDGEKFKSFTRLSGKPVSTATTIFQDTHNRLWMGAWHGGGVKCYDKDQFYRFTKENGLIDNRVVCIAEDNNGNMWFGTRVGLSCYDGEKFTNYDKSNGLMGNSIQSIFRDSKGFLWLATLGGGLSRFNGSDFQVLTMNDGLPSNSVTGVVENPDGSMIISTYRGICAYIPDYEAEPLSVRIDNIEAGKIYSEFNEIKISESINSVRIDYHTISHKTNRIRYKYILEGHDEDWHSTWDNSVTYRELPIGNYKFKVLAINKDFIQSIKAAEVEFEIITDPKDKTINKLDQLISERTEELRITKAAKYYIDSIIKSMPVALIVIDLDSTIKTINQTALDMLGYEEDEIVGKSINSILSDDGKLEAREIYDLMENSRINNLEKTYISKDKKRIPVLFSGAVMFDETSNIHGIICSALDITRRKMDQERIEHLNNVLKAIRNVNQLIFREKNQAQLTREACETLIETRGYYDAWIMLLDDKHEFLSITCAGFDDRAKKVLEQMGKDFYPLCIEEAIKDNPDVISKSWAVDCNGCPISEYRAGKGRMIMRIEYDGSIYGIMSVSAPEEAVKDPEEIALFREVVNDIALALHDIRLQVKQKEAEEAHRNAELSYRRLYENMLDGIVYCDMDGVFVDCNPAYEEMLGYTIDELRNLTYPQLTPEKWHEYEARLVEEKIIGEGYSGIYEKEYIRKDGTVFPVELNSYLIRDEEGNPKGMWGIARDITERKKTREQINNLAKFPSENPFPVIRINEDGTVIYANQAALPLIKDWGGSLNEKLSEEWQKLISAIIESGSVKLLEISADNHIIALNFIPVVDADYVNVYGLDITRRKEAEQEIKKLNEELEQRVAARTAELENVNKELREFAYIVSHDLKAPLRAISQLAHWIYQDYSDKFDQEGKEHMELLINRTYRMNNLIDSILKYSRVGRVFGNQEWFDLNELVREEIEMINPTGNIEITIKNVLPEIFAEKLRIQQVFQNLLDNAVKFMDKPEGIVEIESEDMGDKWKISVTDNGPGIEEKYHTKIFQIFQTLTSKDEEESTGIGLTIVKKIIELHGGEIWLQSKPGEGCKFIFTLPKVKDVG